MQFIKPSYVERLLKLKTSEDIAEWRKERKANFPTKLKRESTLNNLNIKDLNQDRRFSDSRPSLNNSDKFLKFNRNNKFNNQKDKFKNRNNNSRQKRPFNSKNQHSIEPKIKDFKSNETNINHNDGLLSQQNPTEINSTIQDSSPADLSNEINLIENQQKNSDEEKNRQDQINLSNDQNKLAKNVNKEDLSNQNRFSQFKSRRQPTLLEKMLLADVKRNEDTILKCIELIVRNDYLSNDADDKE